MKTVINALYFAVGLCLVVTHNNLVGQVQVLYTIKETGYHIRPEWCMWQIECTTCPTLSDRQS